MTLIFFLVAGTIAPRVPSEVRLFRVPGGKAEVAPNVLAISAVGGVFSRQGPVDPAGYVAALHAAAIGRLAPNPQPLANLTAGGGQAIPMLGDSFADMAAGSAVPVAPTPSATVANPVAPLPALAPVLAPVLAIARPIEPPGMGAACAA